MCTTSQVGHDSLIRKALDLYREDTGAYPDSRDGLEILLAATEASGHKYVGPYLSDPRELIDAWGNALRYECPCTRDSADYCLWSIGENSIDEFGQSGGDDIGY